MALTDTEIRRAKRKEKAYRMSDSGGMYLWVTPAGGKLWRWAYAYGGKEKLMSFGKYPDVSLAMARERHGEARKLLATGIDPMAQRKAEKTAEQVAKENSFASIAAQWLEHWQHGKSTRHVDSTRRRLAANILPSLGTRPIAEIEAPDLVAMVKAIEERGARDIAKRALETTGQIFRFGIACGYVKRNPASEIRPSDILKVTRKKNYSRIDVKQLPHLLKQIEVYPGTHVTRLAMKLMALTFVRTSELVGARWDEFDLKAARWDIPAERMKMRTPHVVPLATQALEILETLRELTGYTHGLFAGDRNPKRPMSNNNTILKGLERMGYKGKMTGHGFRGLASTILHDRGYAHDHVELQLGHAPRNAVSAANNHLLHLKARTKMMQEWADFLEQTQRGEGAAFPWKCGIEAPKRERLSSLQIHSGTIQSLEHCLCNFLGTQQRRSLCCCQTPQDLPLAMACNFALAKKGRQDLLMSEVLAPRPEFFDGFAYFLSESDERISEAVRIKVP